MWRRLKRWYSGAPVAQGRARQGPGGGVIVPAFAVRRHWSATLVRGLVALVVVPVRWVTSSWTRSVLATACSALTYLIGFYEDRETLLEMLRAAAAFLTGAH